MQRWAWSILWWITVTLSFTALTAQEPHDIERKKVAGKVLRLDQSPWPGAAVTLVGTAHPQFWQLGEPDTVHTTTDDRGRFYAELLPWRTYSAWAHGEHPDGGYRLTDIANTVIAGTEAVLHERPLRQCATEIRLVDDGNGERPLGPLSLQFLCLLPEHAYRVPVTFDADGVAKVPPLPGWRAQFEAVTDHGVRVWRTVLPLTEPLRDKIVRGGDTGDHEFPRDRIHTATLHLPKPWPVQFSVFVDAIGPAAGAEILLGAPSSGGYIRDALDCRPIARTDGNGKAAIPMYVRRDDSDRLLPPAPDLIVRAPGCLEVVAPMLRSNAFTGPFGNAMGIGLQPGGALLRGRLWLGPGRPAANVDLLFCWKPHERRGRSDDERTLPFRTDREGRFEIPCTSTTQPWRLSALLPVRAAEEREEHALVGSLGDVAPELGDIYANELVPLRIAVRDGNGTPMDRAVLHVGEPGGPDAPWTWVTDKLGHCTVRVPPRTPLAVFAATPQGVASKLVHTGAGAPVEVELVVAASLTLSGKVVDMEGRPLSDAVVAVRTDPLRREPRDQPLDEFIASLGKTARTFGHLQHRTDATGRFSIPLATRRVRVELLAWREAGDGSFWGQVGEAVTVNVREKGPPPVELVLQLRN